MIGVETDRIGINFTVGESPYFVAVNPRINIVYAGVGGNLTVICITPCNVGSQKSICLSGTFDLKGGPCSGDHISS
jgi:hypothetical protein